jgi:hypothetical protein
MSNDDQPTPWEQRLDEFDPSVRPHLILTVCPTESSIPVLRKLRRRYRLFFWIMRFRFKGVGQITGKEEVRLKALGTVRIFTTKAESYIRAKKFKKFIEDNLR